MVTVTKSFKAVQDKVIEAIDSLREMLHTIDGNSVGGKKLKNRIRKLLTDLEAIQKELNG